MFSHAAMPTPLHKQGDLFHVYCAGRDVAGRSQVGFFEMELHEDDVRVGELSEQPVLGFGELGAFDDRGVLNTSFVTIDSRLYMYYVGVATSTTVPFRNFTGLAISDNGGKSFVRYSRGPILPPDDIDPFLTPLAFVLPEHDGYTMWYTSGVRWAMEGGTPKHFYHIKRARSRDGIRWEKRGDVAIDFIADEYAIARPWVIRDADCYRMWYAHRGQAYRIGYAESVDGIAWTRRDDVAGLLPSTEPWENVMVEYAAVFDHAGRRYMLYNGNQYGQGGVGLAVWEGNP